MRSLVTLGLEQFEIDWGKHIHGFQDFSALFLPSDRTPLAYDYPDEVVEQIQNQVLVIFDNDVAGNDAFTRCRQLTLPPSMHICKLPAHRRV
jgi:hypothetical protein